MFGLQRKETALDEAIDAVTGSLFLHEPDTKEYSATLAQLERLYALKTNSRRGVSPDTLAIVMGNLAGILIIVNFERLHLNASKAYSYLKQVTPTTKT